MTRLLVRLGLWVAAPVWLALVGGPAFGAEPFAAFLEGLRRQQMFDVAVDYLEWARTSPLVSKADQESIDYEAAVTLIEDAKLKTDSQKRLSQLDAARKKFEQFLAQHPEHPQAGSARLQLGNILVERGKTLADKGRRSKVATEKDALLGQARELLSEAQKVFAEAESRFQAEFDLAKSRRGGKAEEDDDSQVELRESRLDLIQAHLYGGHVLSELAHTHADGSPEFRQLLTQAAAKYGETFEKYRRILGGLYGRMWQGRCLQELGDTKQALAYYQELLALPDDAPEFRSLRAKTLRLALQCWSEGDEPKLEEVVRRGDEWLRGARGDEERGAEGLAIRWLVTSALDRRGADATLENAQRKRAQAEALKQAQIVAKYPGDHQKAARELVARYKKTEISDAPTTLAEARDQGKAALDEYESTERQIASLPADDPQVAGLREQARTQRDGAIALLRLALSLADDEATVEERCQVRYFLCYLYFRAGWHYDAAVLGEFVAARYPESSSAKSCAALAVAAYVQAYNAAPADDRAVETARLVALANQIATKWPGDTEADKAWMILADMALRSQQLAQAAEYFSHVSAESPQRTTADLKAGQALWAEYLGALRQPTDARPDAAALEAQLDRAQGLLEKGVAATRKQVEATGGAVDYSLAAAELSLAQLYLARSQFERAVETLERKQQGPLALARGDSPVAKQGNLAIEIYKAALQAYVGAQSLDKAEAVMAALDKQAAGEGAAAVTRIYVSLGRELEQQVARLTATKQAAALERVTKSFEVFLDKIAARQAGNTFQSLHWVAETYLGLGSGMEQQGQPTAEGKRYLEKAAKAYEGLLERIKEKPDFAPTPEAAASLSLRLARCKRLLGAYPQAIELLVGVLKTRPKMLDAQVEAATTLQAWGKKDSQYLAKAVQGDRLAKAKDGTTLNILWGWRKIVAMVQGNPKFRETYYEAYYHLAECLLLQAEAAPAAEKAKHLQAARAAVEQLARTDPNLANDALAPRYDELLKRIQKQLGQPALGLKGLSTARTSATAGAN